MINIIDKQKCSGCHACYNSCPQKCICMYSDHEGFWYPEVDAKKCSNCSICEKACPILSKKTISNNPVAYACFNTNEVIRQNSSSGGVFSVIAEKVIDNGGMIFGAGFDSNFNVVHSWTDSAEGLNNLRGSKYVQSRIGDTFKKAYELLEEGRQVLFSGTPCQIAGLKSYLGKEYQGLTCLDIICHGVPSPLVWEMYRSKVVKNKELKTVSFRDKKYGWKKFSISFIFEDEEIFREQISENQYIKGFLQNLYLRPSCYNCQFKTINRQSDLTLADFWGIEKLLPSFDDDRGTSLVLINSQKGHEILAAAADNLKCETVNLEQALAYNHAALKSVETNPARTKFFNDLSNSKDICEIIARYSNVNLYRKIFSKSKKIIKKFTEI